jgi:hypothetical protein
MQAHEIIPAPDGRRQKKHGRPSDSSTFLLSAKPHTTHFFPFLRALRFTFATMTSLWALHISSRFLLTTKLVNELPFACSFFIRSRGEKPLLDGLLRSRRMLSADS